MFSNRLQITGPVAAVDEITQRLLRRVLPVPNEALQDYRHWTDQPFELLETICIPAKNNAVDPDPVDLSVVNLWVMSRPMVPYRWLEALAECCVEQDCSFWLSWTDQDSIDLGYRTWRFGEVWTCTSGEPYYRGNHIAVRESVRREYLPYDEDDLDADSLFDHTIRLTEQEYSVLLAKPNLRCGDIDRTFDDILQRRREWRW